MSAPDALPVALVDPLRAEHTVLQVALEVLGQTAGLVARRLPVPPAAVLELVRLISQFGDQEHIAKEEQALVPALHAAGMPLRYGPLALMLLEHQRSRELSREMVRAAGDLGRAAAQDAFCGAVRDYLALIETHIEREEKLLYPMADQVVAPERVLAVREAFARVDRARESGGCEQVKARLEELRGWIAATAVPPPAP